MRASRRNNSRVRDGGWKNSNDNYNRKDAPRKGGLVSPETKSFMYGIGAGILLTALFPQLKGSLKPMAAGTVKGAMSLVDKVQEMISELREGIEDIVSEAKFENLKSSLDQEIMDNIAGDIIGESKAE